jgi:hypothetical protein
MVVLPRDLLEEYRILVVAVAVVVAVVDTDHCLEVAVSHTDHFAVAVSEEAVVADKDPKHNDSADNYQMGAGYNC